MATARDEAKATPELCVVVLSYRNENTIVAAVESLLEQGEELEIVVSHSGGGETEALLRRFDGSVRLLAVPWRRLPGAARNAGIEATRAPYISFLAGDCVAAPGWARGRLLRHRAGALAVASALAPLRRSLPSLASHLLQHNYRIAHCELPTSPFSALRSRPAPLLCGLSYARHLFDRFGTFPETFATDEDSAFNSRLVAADVHIEWAPEVVSLHAYPGSIRSMLGDLYQRGRLSGSVQRGGWRVGFACRGLIEPPIALIRARRRAPEDFGRDLWRVTPLLLAGAAASTAGCLRGGLPASPSAVHFARQQWRDSLSRLIDRSQDGAGPR